MLIKLFRIAVLIVFVVMTGLFGYYFYNANFNVDKTYPTITLESDSLEIPLKATDEDLLVGVTAYDEKDGDLTSSVMVESISKFTTKGVSTVTYAVCDRDNHVAVASRKITYRNYTSPRFTMNSAFVFSSRSPAIVKDVVGATDCIDGDISDNVIITSSDYKSKTVGQYSCTLKVSNSKGDTSSIEIPLIVEERSSSAPIINLKDYLIYVKTGSSVDFDNYVDSVTDVTDVPLEIPVQIDRTEFNSRVPGVYPVHYYVTDENDRVGHTVLIVVVEDN